VNAITKSGTNNLHGDLFYYLRYSSMNALDPYSTFYGGDIPLDPNNIRRENGPSDTDIRNRFTLSFYYKPQIMLGNKIVKNVLDDFAFSGGEVASGGQPIYLGSSVEGTIYSGSTSSTSYGDDGGIYGGAISSGSGSPSNGRPPYIGRNSIYQPGYNDFDFRITRDFPIHDSISMELVGEAFNCSITPSSPA
jgi:hypothetical protein